MAPRRPPTRKRATPDPKQRSISDFFSATTSPQAAPRSIASRLFTPVKARPPSTEAANQPTEAHGQDASPKSSRYRPHRGGRDSRDSRPSPHPVASTLRASPWLHTDAMHSETDKKKPDAPAGPFRGRVRAPKIVDEEQCHPMAPHSSLAPTDDPPLTQEELQVHDQLKALECSQDCPNSTSKHSSPSKRPISGQSSAHPKRKRIAEPAKAPESVLTPGTLAPARLMFESDDDGSTPSGLKSGPSPAGTTASDEDEDDSNDEEVYAELRKHEEAHGIRRSSRLARETIRFDPGTSSSCARGSSVFGTSLFGEQLSSKSATTALKAIMRDRGARERQEAHITQMRENMAEEKNMLTEKEEVFHTMAKEEQQREQKRVAALEKYSSPIPLFTTAAALPEMKTKYMRKPSGQVIWHSLHYMAVEILKAGNSGEMARQLLVPAIAKSCVEGTATHLFVLADIIFHWVIYDETMYHPGAISRDPLLGSLLLLCEKNLVDSGQGRLPTLVSVLESYGAFFEDSGVPEAYTTRTASFDSLEASMCQKNPAEPGQTSKAKRNLRRLFSYAAARVQQNDKLHRVISRKLVRQDRAKSVLYSLGICVRVLLSVFGSQIGPEVGNLISALLYRVSEKHWSTFRRSAAKYVLSISTRLGLHVELVTHLLPYHTERAQSLTLDIGFLSLVQWSRGPGENPQHRQIHDWEPSSSAKAIGTEIISFCLADLVDLAKQIPDFQKSTDVEWACGIARMLKQVLADQAVLNRRGNGELKTIHQSLTKLRTCAHRLEFGLAVQEMRLALDALLLALRELVGNSRSVLSEISQRALPEKVQCQLQCSGRKKEGVV